MSREIVIIGASGHGKVIADIVLCSGDTVFGFLDDSTELGDSFMGFPILGKVNDYHRYPDKKFIIAIGNSATREKVADLLSNVKWYTAVHPSAVISNMAVSIGEGTVIMANAVVNPGSSIGRHCIVNTGAVVEHDNTVCDYSHISVGAKTAGNVYVGRHTWLGIGACISNNVTVCGQCMIGAGAAVVKDITDSGTYVGVPAKKII